MHVVGLIPSRLNSARLPSKALLTIDGLPLVVHTMKRAQLSESLDDVYVCTDSEEIGEAVIKHGGKYIMTSSDHINGTERIAEASKDMEVDLIIDIQGDEPMVDPNDIDKVIEFHKENRNFDIVVPSLEAKDNISSRNLVKVLFSRDGKILYFSRAKIPFNYKDKKIKYFRDLSIVSFKFDALKKYSELKPGKLEIIEGIELIRALENNMNLGTFIASGSGFAVDVNQDLMRAIDVMPNDKIRKLY